MPELIDYLKKNEGKANYGSSGVGTSGHLSVVMFEQATGTKMTHIPYKSTTDVVSSMLGGNIDLAIDSMTTVWPQAKQGLVRPLGVTTPARSATAPDVPAIGETVKGFESVAWQGLFAPAGVPEADRRKDRGRGQAHLEPARGQKGAARRRRRFRAVRQPRCFHRIRPCRASEMGARW